jgi:hypothetical protein
MKRLIIALVVGCALFGTVFAVAAALNLNNIVLQAGGDTDMTCDADGFQIYWHQEFTNGDFYVTGVTVGGVSGSCIINDLGGNKTLEIVVTDASHANIGGGSLTLVTDYPDPQVNFAAPILASSVEDIHALVY